jgi:heme-degrading monooxygenase HmoA
MFARKLTMNLKPNMAKELARTFDTHIIPTLRKQKGFKEEFVFVAPAGNEAFAISLWDGKENAEAYSRSTYPELLKNLNTFIEGTPQVHTYEVLASTLHKSAAGASA